MSDYETIIYEVDGTAATITLNRPDVMNAIDNEVPDLLAAAVTEANADDEEYSNTTEFQVTDLNPEMANTDMQMARLKRIADITGGKCLSLAEFDQLSDAVDRTPHTTTTLTDHSLWSYGWVAVLVIALMGFEWILRRRYDLP